MQLKFVIKFLFISMEKFVILFTVPKKVLVAIQDIIKIGKTSV